MVQDLNKLRVKELNEICKKFSLKTGGRKADIIQRIKAHPAYQQSLLDLDEKSDDAKGVKRSASLEPPPSLKKPKKDINVAIDLLFDQYHDPEEPDAITDDGILSFCDHLGIDPCDPVILVLSWYMQAKSMCVFERKEFQYGLEKLECRTMDELKAVLPKLRAHLQNRTEFTEVYSYTFGFAKDPTQKSMALDTALGLWELLLPQYFPLLHHWLRFVKSNCRNSISKDLWMQILEFGLTVTTDLSNFDENSAWPVLIDDFVTYMKECIASRGLDSVLKEGADGDVVME